MRGLMQILKLTKLIILFSKVTGIPLKNLDLTELELCLSTSSQDLAMVMYKLQITSGDNMELCKGSPKRHIWTLQYLLRQESMTLVSFIGQISAQMDQESAKSIFSNTDVSTHTLIKPLVGG